MLYWTAVFFIIALVAGALGFFGIAAGAASIAKILFIVFLVLAVVSLVGARSRRGARLEENHLIKTRRFLFTSREPTRRERGRVPRNERSLP
jgi:uncharacterized membrane protein YtjA (UPF0391 family)